MPLTLRFSAYELDFARKELRCEGALVALQPTPLRVLLYLAEHRDRTVSRRELLDAIRPGVVVGDEALTTALAEARHAVGDDGAAQRVIRTLKGPGYRFVAEGEVLRTTSPARAEEPLPETERRLTAILSGDVVGYSRLIAEDEAGTVCALREVRETIGAEIARHRGRLSDFTGDNFLAEFVAARDAVECALEIQRALVVRNSELPEPRWLRFRIGAHLGDVRHEDGRLYGDGVNIAARLQPLAEPGGLCLSAALVEQVRGKVPLALEDLGEQVLKNLPNLVHAFRARAEEPAPGATGSAWSRRWRSALRIPSSGRAPIAASRRAWLGACAAALAAGAIAAFILLRDPAAAPPPELAPFGFAVLPIESFAAGSADQELAAGLTEHLTHALAANGFPVVARTTAAQWKGRAADVRELGRALGVSHLLEGSLQRGDQRVRVTIQLIETDSGKHVWSEVFEEPEGGPFNLQDQVSARVVWAVFRHVDPTVVSLRSHPELNSVAAMYGEAQRVFFESKWEELIEVGERILANVPARVPFHGYRGALHSLISVAWWNLYGNGPRSLEEAGPHIMRHAQAAVAEAPEVAHSQLSLALAHMTYWQWAEAKRAVDDACPKEDLNPINIGGCGLTRAMVCAAIGCAEDQLQGARLFRSRLPALVWSDGGHLASALVNNFRLEEAEEASLRARNVNPAQAWLLHRIRWRLGHRNQAVEDASILYAAWGLTDVAEEIKGRGGESPEAAWRWIAERWDSGGMTVSPNKRHFEAAQHYAELADEEATLGALERSLASHEPALEARLIDPIFDPIRNTPRFRALTEKMGLTAYHAKYLKRPRVLQPVAPTVASDSARAAQREASAAR